MIVADGPAQDLNPERIGEFAHLRLLAGKPHQWPDRKTELHAQHHLAGDEQLGRLALAVETDDEHRRDDGDAARDQTAQPGRAGGC